MLSQNTNDGAIELLKHNQDKIYWERLSKNTNMIEYDYYRMKKTRCKLTKELMEFMFHPKNIRKWKSWGFEEGI